jgi:hypothetical protein
MSLGRESIFICTKINPLLSLPMLPVKPKMQRICMTNSISYIKIFDRKDFKYWLFLVTSSEMNLMKIWT